MSSETTHKFPRDFRGTLENFEVEEGFMAARLDGIGHTVLLAVERFDAETSVVSSLEELNEGVVTFHAVKCVIPGDEDLSQLQQWNEGDWSIVALSKHADEQ